MKFLYFYNDSFLVDTEECRLKRTNKDPFV